MSLAFPALLVVLLVLPGIVLRYAYLRGFWANSPFATSTLTDEIAYGSFWAVLLHFLWASLLTAAHRRIGLEPPLLLLLGTFGQDQKLLPLALAPLLRHPAAVAGYFIGLYLFSGALGYAGHALVRGLRLDRRTRLLRFHNEWYYLISGEIFEFAEVGGPPRTIAGVYLSTVIQQGDSTYLYRGIVADYFFDKAGALDRVLLTDAHRRLLSADRGPGEGGGAFREAGDARYYDIRGSFFLIRYAEMQTINFEYIEIAEVTDADNTEDASPSAPEGLPLPQD